MKTGVVLRKKRWIGGKDGYEVTEYEINSALIECLNSVERRAAVETGQEVDRQDVNLRGKVNDEAEVLKKTFSFHDRGDAAAGPGRHDAEQTKPAPPANIIELKPVLEAGQKHETTAPDTGSAERKPDNRMARPVPIAGECRLNRLKGENAQRDRYRLLHPVFAERLRAHQDRAEAEAKERKRSPWRRPAPDAASGEGKRPSWRD